MKKNEDDLVAFFDAGKTTEKVTADVEKKIHTIRDDAATKIAAAEREQAVALRTTQRSRGARPYSPSTTVTRVTKIR